jgi:hypothetical protein
LQCDDFHKRYLILRNCREAPSFFNDVYNEAAKLVGTGSIHLRQLLKKCDVSSRQSLNKEILKLHQNSGGANQQAAAIFNFDLPGNGSSRNTYPGSCCKSATEAGVKMLENDRFSNPSNRRCTLKESTFSFQREAILERQFFSAMTSVTQYRGPGYNKDKVLEDAIAQTPVGAIWDTSHPFAAALCKPWVSVLTVILFASITFNLGLGVNLMRKNALHTGQNIRFTAVDDHSVAGISSFGFLNDACSHKSLSILHWQSQNINKKELTVTFAEEFSMNGWWVSIPLASIDQFPTRFYVEISGWTNDSWTKVGSSSFFWTWSGSVTFFEGSFNVSQPSQSVKTYVQGQEMVVEFDMRLPWIWCYAKGFSNTMLIFMTVSVSAASYLKRQMQGRFLCAFFWLMVHFVELLACLGYLYIGQTALAMLSGVFSASDLIYAFMLAFHEKFYRQLNGVCGSLFFGAVVAHYLYLDSPQQVIGCCLGFENRGVVEGIGLLMLSFSGYMARMYSRRSAEQVIAELHSAYDNCWKRLLQLDDKALDIKLLGEYTDSITRHLPKAIRQRGSASDEQVPAEKIFKRTRSKLNLSACTVADKKCQVHPQHEYSGKEESIPDSQGALVLDLDQLFAQAEGVDLLLQLKVQQWALLSRGCFPVISSENTVTFERWEKIACSEDMLANVKWGRVKSRKRAIEKLYRSYNCDVSRLLDCCRKSIVFDGINDLLTCMKAITTDPECKVVRAKNRLRPDYDSSVTAGYRDVVLNLQVLTNETRRLRIETHVCEVQLLTIDFAKLKVRILFVCLFSYAAYMCALAGSFRVGS